MPRQFIRYFLSYSKLDWILNHMVLTQKRTILQATVKGCNNPNHITTLTCKILAYRNNIYRGLFESWGSLQKKLNWEERVLDLTYWYEVWTSMEPARGSGSRWGTSKKLVETQAWNSRQRIEWAVQIWKSFIWVKTKRADDVPGKRMKIKQSDLRPAPCKTR